MKRKLLALAVIAATLAVSNAIAANPTAALDKGWVEYTGTGAVGNNNINDNNNAYWVYESSGTWMGQAVNSWFVFWDPRSGSRVEGDISFDQNILFVHDDKAELIATAAFGKAGVTYDYSRNLVGLEAGRQGRHLGHRQHLVDQVERQQSRRPHPRHDRGAGTRHLRDVRRRPGGTGLRGAPPPRGLSTLLLPGGLTGLRTWPPSGGLFCAWASALRHDARPCCNCNT